MNRIEHTFKQGKVFAAYLTAGACELSQQQVQIRALIAGGVNLLEIGVPFSDPIADGIVIQRAMQRALERHTHIFDVINLIKWVRSISEIPIILFTYYNPILAVQQHNILALAKAAGVDGILVVDLPFFEGADHLAQCQQLGLAPIAVIAPTTPEDQLKERLLQAQGFIYYACQTGTTGVRRALPEGLNEKILQIKQASSLPVLVGFGIADRIASTAAVLVADGFVVGSYFIQAIEQGITVAALQQLALDIKPI